MERHDAEHRAERRGGVSRGSLLALFCAGFLLQAGRPAAAAPSFQLLPPCTSYPGYIADPRRPEFGVAVLGYPDARIPDSGDLRFGLKLAGRFGLLRFGEWQMDIDPDFIGRFDSEHSLDNIGWGGIYNFLFSTALRDYVHVQLGTKRVSSHMGDEYAEGPGGVVSAIRGTR